MGASGGFSGRVLGCLIGRAFVAPVGNARFCASGFAPAWPTPGRTANVWGRPVTAALHANQVRKLRRAGLSKSEIARRLNFGRIWVRRILSSKKS